VTLTIHDLAGRRIGRILEATLAAGEHELAWDGCDASGRPAPAGVYYGRLCADGAERTARLVRLRTR
jgi:flagellar hook assembly protein FlgD